jgi:hypothetical protein
MAGLKQPLNDMLALCGTVPGIQYVRVWNNQLSMERAGKLYDYPKPAIFVEIVSNPVYQELGQYMQDTDLGFRLHLIHEYYDAQDGTFEQDLVVFDLRDAINRTVTSVMMTACGPLVKRTEGQDYDHDNLYHYIIEYTCSFIDSTGSPLDPASGKFVNAPQPIAVEVDASYVDPSSYPGIDAENIKTTFQSVSNYQIP